MSQGAGALMGQGAGALTHLEPGHPDSSHFVHRIFRGSPQSEAYIEVQR